MTPFLPSLCIFTALSLAAGTARAQGVITLEQAYDRALATDQTIRIAELQIREANLLRWSALTRLGPRVTGDSSFDRSGRGTFANDANTRGLGLTFVQPLLDFGVFPAWKLGKLAAASARFQHQFTVRQTLFGVAQAYYAVLKEESVVEVNRQTVALAAQQLEVSQKRAAAGEVARSDVLRAQASLEDARRLLIENEGTLDLNRDTFSNILNLGGKTNFTLVHPPDAREGAEPFDQLLARAYERREDYQTGALAVRQEMQRRNGIWTEYFPTVVARAGEDWTTLGGDNATRSSNRFFNASLGLSMPFLTGGQREIDLRNAGYQIDIARLNYEKLGKTIEAEMKTAWLQVRTLREALKALRAEVVAAEQNYHDLQTQYQAGVATSVDVLVGLRDLNNSRTQLTGAVFDYQVALRNLLRAQAVFEQPRVERAKRK